MKFKFFFLYLFIFFFGLNLSAQYRSAYSELNDSETVAAMKSHIRYFASFELEGRKAGSEGEKMAADYFAESLKQYGVDVISPEGGDVFGISVSGDTLVSRNVIGFIQGSDPDFRDKYIVIGARLDNLGSDYYTVDNEKVRRVYLGANGNASGLAMLLELARMLQTNSMLLKRSVLLVGFGASNETFAGSWYFLNRSFKDVDKIESMINLDILGCGTNGFYVFTASNPDLNTIVRRMTGQLQPLQPQLVTYEAYPSDNRSFYAAEIPSATFTTGKYPEHNTERDTESIINYDEMERILEYIYNFSLEMANTSVEISFRDKQVVEHNEDKGEVYSYSECDVRPMFLNSSDIRQFMQKWVYQYLKYPESAVKNGIQGRVMVDFIIEADGKVSCAKVVKSVSEELDAEALKVVAASPKWRPARVNGKKVRCSITIPVEFRLEKKSSFGINKRRIK